MPTTVLIVGGVVAALLLTGLLALLLRSLAAAARTIDALASRLQQVEDRTGQLQQELAGLDDGLGDVAAALREHRPSHPPAVEGEPGHTGGASRQEPR